MRLKMAHDIVARVEQHAFLIFTFFLVASWGIELVIEREEAWRALF